MHDKLDQLFKTDLPTPDENRKKEALNLATTAFEARKSAVLEKSENSSQGMVIFSRLISHRTKQRRNTMTPTHKKYVYGGIIGGLATACVALLIYDGGMNLPTVTGDMASLHQIAENQEEPKQFVVADSALVDSPKKETIKLKEESSSRGAAPMAVAPAPSMAYSSAGAAGMAYYGGDMSDYAMPQSSEVGRDKFSDVQQNSVLQVKDKPVSTFSIDVDTASYSFVRKSLDGAVLPQADAVRIEEMVNYFDYAYPLPTNKEEPFKASVAVKDSPWNKGKNLMTIGIKGFDVEKTNTPDSNLVFLLDTSGSMNENDKLPLLKQSLSMLLDTLKPTDRVSIVVYAGSAGTILEPTQVSEKNKIIAALQNLSAGGSTAGGEGIRLAYQMAQRSFDKNSVNRVILATDGDFNVGITNPDELQGFVEREREKGVFLSVLGFGRGNYNDDLMQKLAQNGNGVAAYIDTINEARKVLVEEASATLFPIAKDVKIQVEFNPSAVSEYRLVGYETRALKTEDFNNDKVDAGDIGAGAEVTAIYEFTPVGGTKTVDDLRYGNNEPKGDAKASDEYAFVKIRYKLPKENESKLITTPVTRANEKLDASLLRETNWAENVAGFAQLLKGGKFTGSLTYDDVLKAARENMGDDPFGTKAEFITLVHKAKTSQSLPVQDNSGYYHENVQPIH